MGVWGEGIEGKRKGRREDNGKRTRIRARWAKTSERQRPESRLVSPQGSLPSLYPCLSCPSLYPKLVRLPGVAASSGDLGAQCFLISRSARFK